MHSLVVHLAAKHSNEPNFSISCYLKNDYSICCAVFKSAASYKTHLYRYHRKAQAESLQLEIMCSICETWLSNISAISAHYKNHSDESKSVICLVERCNFDTKSHSSYQAYTSWCHKNMTVSDI